MELSHLSKPQKDLGERTFEFARNVRRFVRALPKTLDMMNDGKQLIRSSGSVGANYIEANESLGRKDLLFRFRITRKEAKESMYWLRLIACNMQEQLSNDCTALIGEARQLVLIFSSILTKAAAVKTPE